MTRFVSCKVVVVFSVCWRPSPSLHNTSTTTTTTTKTLTTTSVAGDQYIGNVHSAFLFLLLFMVVVVVVDYTSIESFLARF